MSDYLPQDFVSQILKYLPVKSLLRCRCVCKWWKQLIDSSNFTQEHLNVQHPRIIIRNKAPELVVIARHSLPLMDTLRIPFEHNNEPFQVIGTLHGVVCLLDSECGVWLWNPSIHKLSILPHPQFSLYIRQRLLLSTTGFWIDPSTKNFKVIIIKLSRSFLYSSVEGVWRKISQKLIGNMDDLHGGPAIVIGGVAYWRADLEDTGDVVLSFDFVLEAFDLFETPRLRHGRVQPFVLQKWHDTLSVAFEDLWNSEGNIYLRRQGSWVHMCRFTIHLYAIHVLWVMGETEEKENIRILATTMGDLVLGDGKSRWIDVKKGIQNPTELYLVYDFVQSLLFP